MIIYNSLTKKKEKFNPLNPKKVSIYVCGITPYDTTHLGHAFTYISFDVLIRYLKFKEFEVEYTQNVTDINDRDKDILQRALEQDTTWQKLSEYWTDKFLKDMTALNWISPTHFLYASQQLVPIIRIIEKLLQKNFAYTKNGSVYLDIFQFPNYGKLSRLTKKQMLKTAKDFEEDLDNPNKKHPLDITLWKASTPNQPSHIPSFSSPWGSGRPGWHIECSAMSISTLGEQIDLHGGGVDLKFPHHEAEIAQSEGATGKTPFVKYWLHTGNVSFEGEKMSKSKGNLVMVSDLLKKYSPNAIRWLVLSRHWRENWEYKEKDLNQAQKDVATVEGKLQDGNLEDFIKIMDNDLNTPKALELLITSKNKRIYDILGFKG